MKFAGCTYWINTGKHPLKPIGTATSMHDCDGCVHNTHCPIQKDTLTWPLDANYDKQAIEVTDKFKCDGHAAISTK